MRGFFELEGLKMCGSRDVSVKGSGTTCLRPHRRSGLGPYLPPTSPLLTNDWVRADLFGFGLRRCTLVQTRKSRSPFKRDVVVMRPRRLSMLIWRKFGTSCWRCAECCEISLIQHSSPKAGKRRASLNPKPYP